MNMIATCRKGEVIAFADLPSKEHRLHLAQESETQRFVKCAPEKSISSSRFGAAAWISGPALAEAVFILAPSTRLDKLVLLPETRTPSGRRSRCQRHQKI